MSSASVSARVAKKLQSFGQQHALKYLEELSEPEASSLLAQVDALDLDLVRQAHAFATRVIGEEDGDKITPLPTNAVFSSSSPLQAQEWTNKGLVQIASGKVCAILLAGGQGTRLGFSGPKGSFNPQLNSNKSLFQLSVERLKKVKAMATSMIGPQAVSTLPLYVLTSESNDSDTRQFFKDHAYFGLDQGEIFFFTQGMLPCVTQLDGLLMLETKSQLAMSPDGNGGLFVALDKSGALADMTRRGVEYVHVMAIDNPQNLPGDPAFVGLCVDQQVEAGNLCIPKLHPTERVGVCALRNDAFHVVEYTETRGVDVSNAANICNHFFTLDFLLNKVLPGMKALHHAAVKTIPTVEDKLAKGIKLELFIFDAFPFASRYLAYSSGRRENFAPIKNAEGEDSPATCRALLGELHRSWLDKAGAVFVGEGRCEVSALVSVNGQGLDKLVSGVTLQLPCLIESGFPGVCVDVDEFAKSEWRLEVDFTNPSSVTRYHVIPKRPTVTTNPVLAKLASVDLNNTTPVEALVLLQQLQQALT
ncbi:hypothetical protein BASA81_007290 [Batrachochytrium salamandrivorans]|nr:hypothetical protein BASA81_007290 [Batrachochytrium salamandrivorans]